MIKDDANTYKGSFSQNKYKEMTTKKLWSDSLVITLVQCEKSSVYNKPIASIILKGEKLKGFHLNGEQDKDVHCHLLYLTYI